MVLITYNVICPLCGKVNHGLYLEETGGWMECENCHQLVKSIYPPDRKEKISPFQADNTNRVPVLSEDGCGMIGGMT